MKRFLALLLTMAIFLGVAFAMISCGNADEDIVNTSDISTTSAVQTTAIIDYVPDGCSLYNNGKIAFVYPEEWVQGDYISGVLPSGVVSSLSFSNGDTLNHIGVRSENIMNDSSHYDEIMDITLDSLKGQFVGGAAASSAVQYRDFEVLEVTHNGLDIKKVSYAFVEDRYKNYHYMVVTSYYFCVEYILYTVSILEKVPVGEDQTLAPMIFERLTRVY